MDNLVVKNLSKKYGNTVVFENINLEIKKGIFGLLGPNGAGKTTMMKAITTILKVDSGDISFGDLRWGNNKEVKKLIGYLPQHFSIYETMKVIDVLRYIASLKGIDTNLIDEQIEDILKKTNLLSEKNKKIGSLSGGMLRRVGLCQALLGNPKILVIDEPTTGLDPKNRIIFRNLLNDLAEDRIIIISTHIVEDIEATCDTVCVLNNGEVLFNGSIENLKGLVRGKVKESTMTKELFNKIKGDINLISFKRDADKVVVRFIEEGNKMNFDYEDIDGEIEDAYFYLIGDEYETVN
ncbi:MAG: ATP-binding cassette domain-containing protein [Sarcina sp.]